MKLKEFREFIDKLDDSIEEDVEIVLDIEPKSNVEHLIDIGEIYRSRIDENLVKIEPAIELYTENSLNQYIDEKNGIYKRFELRCPSCGRIASPFDMHCRFCGVKLPRKALKQLRKHERKDARMLRERNRERNRAMKVIKSEKKNDK